MTSFMFMVVLEYDVVICNSKKQHDVVHDTAYPY